MEADEGRRELRAERFLARPLGIVAGLALVFVLGAVAVALAPPDSGVASWWPAAGAAVLLLAWSPARWRPVTGVALVLVTAAANVAAGRTPAAALGFGLANGTEAYVVAWWLTQTVERPTLRTLDDFGRLVAATAMGVVAIGLIAGTTVAALEDGSFVHAATTVMSSHSAAILTLVPLGMRTAHVGPSGRRWETFALTAAVVLGTFVVFWSGQDLPLTFLPLPILVWCAMRLTPRATAGLMALVAVLVTVLSRSGGPLFVQAGAGGIGSALVQAYLLSLVLITLPLAISVAQHRSVNQALQMSERLFRESFTEALLGMALVRRCVPGHEIAEPAGGAGRTLHAGTGLDVVTINAVAARLLGSNEEDLIGRSWSDLLEPHDRVRVLDAIRLIDAERLVGWRDSVRLGAGPEGVVWADVALSPLRPGETAGLYVIQLVDVTAQREMAARLDEQGLRDDLTGLASRALLADRVAFAVEMLEPGGPGLAILALDLVEFRHVNDTDGHDAGDAVLLEVAHRLRSALRPHDVLARPGGDEFTILRTDLESTGEAEEFARTVVALFDEPVAAAGSEYPVAVSIGVAWGEAGVAADGLLRDAELAMHLAKNPAKGSVVVHSDEHREVVQRLVRLERDLRGAVERGELEVFFQPVVDLTDGSVVAAEALTRWRHPVLGLLLPQEWLDVAEASGQMPAIGAWVLEESCREAAGWAAPPEGRAPQVHVNVSARQLEVAGFAALVQRILTETGLAPDRLVLEVTETYLGEIREALARDLADLRSAGIGLAADDFGTGYSPLTRLVDLPVTMIKIDRRFVADMDYDRRSRAVVTAMIGMSASLGLHLVAEGVETARQAAELRRLGCRHGQGFLWSPAVSKDEFRALAGPQPSVRLTSSRAADWTWPRWSSETNDSA